MVVSKDSNNTCKDVGMTFYGTLPKFNWRGEGKPQQTCQYSRSVNRYFNAQPTRV